MRSRMMWLVALLLIGATGQAQNNKTKAVVKPKTVLKQETKPQSSVVTNNKETTTLNSNSSYPAFKKRTDSFTIADPITRALNANANGANLKLGSSGLIGVPRGTYGFANGKIRLYSNGATSSGTATGMGSVGTGGSPGMVGSSGPAMGVNGKNLYASPGSFGTRIPLPWRPNLDSIQSINTNKK